MSPYGEDISTGLNKNKNERGNFWKFNNNGLNSYETHVNAEQLLYKQDDALTLAVNDTDLAV